MKVVLQDVVGAVSKTTKLARPEAKVVVRRIIQVLVDGLTSGQRIEIRNFGVFQVKTVSGRKGRDLNRNLSIALPPYKKVSFKAGKNLRKLFRDLPEEPKVGKNGQLEMPIFSVVPDGMEVLAGSVGRS
jgi:nucleoid DNA-binding protein